jgi:hypothetical protein
VDRFLPLTIDQLADLEPYSAAVTVMKTRYVLTEASADAACKYKNASMKTVRMDDGKLTGFDDGFTDADPLLVHLCLFEANKDDTIKTDRNGRRVNADLLTVRGWPDQVLKAVLAEVKRVSPTLEDARTVEALDAQIKSLAEQRDKLLAAAGGSGDEGKSSGKGSPRLVVASST